MSQEFSYIGDGVYAAEDCGGIVLHANSHDQPTDRIYLEPEVLLSLIAFAKVKGILVLKEDANG